MSMLSLMGALEIGLIFALVALGVWISFRVLDFPDLTADGSFPPGAPLATRAGTALHYRTPQRRAVFMLIEL